MKKLKICLALACIVLAGAGCSYENYNHWKGKTRRGNPRILAQGDTVRVNSLFTHQDFEIIGKADHGRYAAWDLSTNMYALIAESNLEKISK